MPQLTRIGLSPGIGGSVRRGGAPTPPVSDFFNLTGLNSATLKTAIDGAIAGNRRDIVLGIGDSTRWSAWSDNVDSTGLRSQSVDVQLAALLQSGVCPTQINSWVGCGDKTTNAQMKKWSPFFTGATTWNPGAAGFFAVGGQMFNCITVSAALGWNLGVSYNTIQIEFANPAVGGNFDVGTATTGVLQNVARDVGLATNVPRVITVNVGSTVTGAVQITQKTTTAVNIMSVDVYLSTDFKLRLFSAGIPGSRSNDWVTDPAATPYVARAGIAALAPVFIFDELTINDPRLGTSIPTFKANKQILIDEQLARGGGYCLVIGNQRYTGADTNINNGTQTSLALQETFRQATFDLATLNNISAIDMWTLLGDWDALVALGYMATETGGFTSPSHLTAAGNAAKAAIYRDFYAEVAAL